MTNKKHLYIEEHLNIFYNKVQKNSFKKSFAGKSFFGEKKIAILFQSNPFGF
jgi:hypothetical protein